MDFIVGAPCCEASCHLLLATTCCLLTSIYSALPHALLRSAWPNVHPLLADTARPLPAVHPRLAFLLAKRITVLVLVLVRGLSACQGQRCAWRGQRGSGRCADLFLFAVVRSLHHHFGHRTTRHPACLCARYGAADRRPSLVHG